MTTVEPKPVGASKIPGNRHDLSILVGLMGEWTGSLTLKDSVERTDIGISGMTCPALMMGQSYEFDYAAGFTTISVDFEVEEMPVTKMASRLLSVSVSLMKR